MNSPRGTLLLVPNTLDLGAPEAPPIEDVLPAGVLRHAAGLSHWVAEDAKTTRAFLKRVHAVVPLCRALQEMSICELPRPAKGGQGGAALSSGSSPASRRSVQVRIKGRPTSAVGSSDSIAASSAIPSASLLALPAQS